MPSVDRVGRYFPLTIMTPLADIPATAPDQVRLWSWLQCLEDAAIDALQDDWSIAELDAELLRIGVPTAVQQDASSRVVSDYLSEAASQFFSAIAGASVATGGITNPVGSVWYSQPDRAAPRVLTLPLRDSAIASLWQAANA